MERQIFKIDNGILALYTDEEIGKVFKAVVKYVNDFEMPAKEDFSKAEFTLFMIYKKEVDQNEIKVRAKRHES